MKDQPHSRSVLKVDWGVCWLWGRLLIRIQVSFPKYWNRGQATKLPAGKKERGKTLWHYCCNLDPRLGWSCKFYFAQKLGRGYDIELNRPTLWCIDLTCKLQVQSSGFRLIRNSCRKWTGRVYQRPPCAGLRREQRCPQSLLRPICNQWHFIHILEYNFGLKWVVCNSNWTFGSLW